MLRYTLCRQSCSLLWQKSQTLPLTREDKRKAQSIDSYAIPMFFLVELFDIEYINLMILPFSGFLYIRYCVRTLTMWHSKLSISLITTRPVSLVYPRGIDTSRNILWFGVVAHDFNPTRD